MSKKAKTMNRVREPGGRKAINKNLVYLRATGSSRGSAYTYGITVPVLIANRIMAKPLMFYRCSLEEDGRIVFTPAGRIPDE